MDAPLGRPSSGNKRYLSGGLRSRRRVRPPAFDILLQREEEKAPTVASFRRKNHPAADPAKHDEICIEEDARPPGFGRWWSFSFYVEKGGPLKALRIHLLSPPF